MSEVERRTTRRFSLALPLSIAHDGAEVQIHGVTNNVSSSGVSLFSTNEIAIGVAVMFDLELPFEVTLTNPVRARCKGHVVRVEAQPNGGGFAIAIRLDRFEYSL